jgi:hypothetical protein
MAVPSWNPLDALLLKFQLNPIELDVTKEVKYQVDQVQGWEAPIVTWVSSGAKHIRFDLMFDRNEESISTGFTHEKLKPLGVMDFQAILESFLYPVQGFFNTGATTQQKPPPDCYFVYGPRWAKCKMVSAPVKEIVHNSLLQPTRITTSVDLIVLEEGFIHAVNTAVRKGLSIAGTGIALYEVGTALGDA